MTTTTTPLEALLEQGRAKLARQRAEEQAAQDAVTKAAQERTMAAWREVRTVAAKDLHPELLDYSNLLEPPTGFSPYTHEFLLEVEPPGCSLIRARYILSASMCGGKGWHRCGGEVGLWEVSDWTLSCCGDVWRVDRMRGPTTPDLLVALALAEELGRKRDALQAEADAKNAAPKPMSALVTCLPHSVPTLDSRDLPTASTLLFAVQTVVAHMVRPDCIAHSEEG